MRAGHKLPGFGREQRNAIERAAVQKHLRKHFIVVNRRYKSCAAGFKSGLNLHPVLDGEMRAVIFSQAARRGFIYFGKARLFILRYIEGRILHAERFEDSF